MTETDTDGTEPHRHVVYTLDDELKPGHFLAVAEGFEEVAEVSEKWWKAFHTGEKEKPKNYRGISNRPVAKFQQWADGNDRSVRAEAGQEGGS